MYSYSKISSLVPGLHNLCVCSLFLLSTVVCSSSPLPLPCCHWEAPLYSLDLSLLLFFLYPPVCCISYLSLVYWFIFMASPTAYGRSQVRGQMGAAAAGHSHSHRARDRTHILTDTVSGSSPTEPRWGRLLYFLDFASTWYPTVFAFVWHFIQRNTLQVCLRCCKRHYFTLFHDWVVFHHRHGPHRLYPSLCQWTLTSILCLGRCE